MLRIFQARGTEFRHAAYSHKHLSEDGANTSDNTSKQDVLCKTRTRSMTLCAKKKVQKQHCVFEMLQKFKCCLKRNNRGANTGALSVRCKSHTT